MTGYNLKPGILPSLAVQKEKEKLGEVLEEVQARRKLIYQRLKKKCDCKQPKISIQLQSYVKQISRTLALTSGT